MDLDSKYDIEATANFIRTHNYTSVALQFPDDLLKDSTRVVSALRAKFQSLAEASTANGNDGDDCHLDSKEVRLFVMADTAYGSCCVDEVGASHVNANCVIHFGHTCLSPTTTLPAFFVFGKASINVECCVQNISHYTLTKPHPIVVLYNLEYAHAVGRIRQALSELLRSSSSEPKSEIHFADVRSPVMHPSEDPQASELIDGPSGINPNVTNSDAASTSRYSIGGLSWNLSNGQKMENCLLFWIGPSNSAFANAVLTFNGCEIVRYDAKESRMVHDTSQQKRILKRRYYLVERAKDANIVGVLVGTLGVAGYLHMIHQMKDLIAQAGKKAYTLVMGRPNPAKLANFPECEVFVYVSCSQTALLDSKEYLAPVITPFEAMLAFNRESQWTGEYVMEFQDLIKYPMMEMSKLEEARFSFLQGGYVKDIDLQENEKEENEDLASVNATEKALQLYEKSKSLVKGKAKSGAQFLASRSYQGLNINNEELSPEPYLVGRSGRAAAYDDEVGNHVGG